MIFLYYLRLAWVNSKAKPGLTLLMVLAVGLGIGMFMTLHTVVYLMGSNPLAHKEDILLRVQLDSASPEVDESYRMVQMTYIDSMNLIRQAPAELQSAHARFNAAVVPEDADLRPFETRVRGAFGPFFELFDVPFQFGGSWDRQQDEATEHVVVLSAEINDQLFGGRNSVGESINIAGQTMRIVGVMESWILIPTPYDISSGMGTTEDVFMPFNTAVSMQLSRAGNTNCWKSVDGDDFESFLNSECVWIQYFVQLESQEERDEYEVFLENYVESQVELNRFGREQKQSLYTISEWWAERGIVDQGARVLWFVSLMFLVVCVLNTIALMLSKLFGRLHDIAIRRALGATRLSLVCQTLIECAVVGIFGGALGLGLANLGLAGIRKLLSLESQIHLLTTMNTELLVMGLVFAVASTVVAGLYPTWSVCRLQPTSQINAE